MQIREEIDRLMGGTCPSLVWMCLDTAHALYAGVDPIKLTEDYRKRIGHVHLKNVREPVRARAVAGKYSFYRAIREGIFTVPGDPEGVVDFAPVFRALKDANYTGWLIVEAEQDPANACPKKYATMARVCIREGYGV